MSRWLLVGLLASSCSGLGKVHPRFIAVYEQRNSFCTIQVLKDERSTACFVAFRCGRHAVEVVSVSQDVCVP